MTEFEQCFERSYALGNFLHIFVLLILGGFDCAAGLMVLPAAVKEAGREASHF